MKGWRAYVADGVGGDVDAVVEVAHGTGETSGGGVVEIDDLVRGGHDVVDGVEVEDLALGPVADPVLDAVDGVDHVLVVLAVVVASVVPGLSDGRSEGEGGGGQGGDGGCELHGECCCLVVDWSEWMI